MDRAAIESLLREPRLLTLTANRAGREPFVAPVWFEYTSGRIAIWTNSPTAKTRLVQRDPAVTLLVQTESNPYKAVLIRGQATVRMGEDHALIRRLAVHYLGEDEGTVYADDAIARQRPGQQATLLVTPTAWRAWDYAEGSDDAVPWTEAAALR